MLQSQKSMSVKTMFLGGDIFKDSCSSECCWSCWRSPAPLSPLSPREARISRMTCLRSASGARFSWKIRTSAMSCCARASRAESANTPVHIIPPTWASFLFSVIPLQLWIPAGLTDVSQVAQGQEADVDQGVVVWILPDDAHQSGDHSTLDQLVLLVG